MVNKFSKGSEWRKWDLHIHTPVSLCSEYGGQTKEVWEKFFLKLEQLSKDIKVIGINDYLFLEGYQKVLQYKNSGGLKDIELILPVVEFRLKEFVGNNELKRLNYHIIFANDELLSLQQIESHFLSALRGKANLDENSTRYDWGGVVTKESLIDFGRHIYEQTPANKQTISPNFLEIGFNNMNFELSKIEEILGETGDPNSYLKNKYYKAIGKAEWESFRWDGSPSEKKSIINKTHFVFSASPTFEQAIKGRESLTTHKVNSRLLHCSDAHGFAKDEKNTQPKELGHCYTWIKANPTFEGLREILFEYNLRVAIQESYPSKKIPYEVIEGIRFISDDAWDKKRFTPNVVRLNPDLNVVIGGKSSGKSLLLYSIANTIDRHQTFKKEEGSEDRKKDKYDFGKDKIDFEVIWANGTKQILSQNAEANPSNYSILYIPQSYIQKLADTEGRKTRKEVGKIIRDILLQKEVYNKYYEDFLMEVKRLDNSRENLISQYITALDVYKSSLLGIKNIGDKNAIIQYVNQLKEKINELKNKSKVSDEDNAQYDIHTEKLQLLNSRLFELSNDREKIESFKYSINVLINEITGKKDQLLSELKNESIISDIRGYLMALDYLKELPIDIDKLYLHQREGAIAALEARFLNDITISKELLSPLSERFSNREEISKLEQEILIELSKIDKIDAYAIDVNQKKEQAEKIKILLLDEYRKTYGQYVNIVEKLNERGLEIEELALKGSIKFYTKRFEDRLKDPINNKLSSSFMDANRLFENDNGNINDVTNIEEIIARLALLFDCIVDETIVLKSGFSKKDALNALFRDDFFDYWEISSGKDEIANMSPGKAGLVLLKLLIELSDSKCPILIDQPEDNLDNRSIYSDLVQYIREKKKSRQFIVVTHNPNIAVGADAENVIVANQNDQDPARLNKYYQFDYITGALEHTSNKNDKDENILTSMGIREHVTEILEGGKEAFQKRESKYRYSNRF